MADPGQQLLSYRFDDVFVERKLFRILKHDDAKTLRPRAFDLLIYLIENRERVLEKQELFEHVWKGSFVSDSALTQAIKEIRHAIGDEADAPRYIRTVHKHGYRFIADVSEEREPAATPAHCIAVLPFMNLSGTPENEYFCDGLTEDILNSLTRVQHLRVVARTSAFSLRHQELDVREIGRRLNATTVLEGSALRAGSRLRVFTQLINAADGYHLWSQRFDRQAEDVFAIQDEITEAIISKLRIRLLADEQAVLGKRYTENVEAYHLYLKGRYFWNKRFIPGAMQKAMENFQKAIEIDSQYALAYTGLADCYSLMGIFQFRAPDDLFPKAMESAEKAIKIDDTLAEAHTSLAYTLMLYGCNWQGAEHEFKEAIRLKPQYAQAHLWYAQYLSALMRCDEAIAEAKRAKELDPINLGINANLGLVLYGAREYKEAIEQLEQTLALDPDFGLASFYLGLTLVKVKRYAEAIAAYKAAMKNTGGMPLPMVYLGYAYGQSGQRAIAKKLLQKLETQFKERGYPSAGLAWIHLGLGDFDKLFQCLNQAYIEHNPLLFALKVLPEFDKVRQDPRFQELLHRMHLD